MSFVDPPGVRRHRRAARTWRGMSPWLWSAVILAIVAGIAVALILAKAAGDGTPPWAQDSGVRPVVPAPVAPPLPPEGALAGDGRNAVPVQTYVVGVNSVGPGTYATPGALDSQASGRWEQFRFRTQGGAPRRVDSGGGPGPVSVDLEVGDVLVTSGYQPWKATGAGDE